MRPADARSSEPTDDQPSTAASEPTDDQPSTASTPGGNRLETTPELPDLDPGITLLSADDPTPLRSLVVDHLLGTDGEAVWVDAGGLASTPPLLRLAPGRHTLERIRVARGFTAFQHRALLDRLGAVAGDDTALLVVPRIDYPYRGDDCLDEEGEQLLVDSIAALSAVVREHDLPALVTRHAVDAASVPVENAADREVAVESTPFGPRFVGDDVETLVYPGEGYVQTTLAFWRRVLSRRHDVSPGVDAAHRTGATADGSRLLGGDGAVAAGDRRPAPTVDPLATPAPDSLSGGWG